MRSSGLRISIQTQFLLETLNLLTVYNECCDLHVWPLSAYCLPIAFDTNISQRRMAETSRSNALLLDIES